MRSSSYNSRDLSYLSPAVLTTTGPTALKSPTFADVTMLQNELADEQFQNQLQDGNQLPHQNNFYHHSVTSTAGSTPQHIHAAAKPQTPQVDGLFLSKSPYSDVEQAGKIILRSARLKLDARRKARPISVEQKTSTSLQAKALRVVQNQSSPSVNDLKRQLWSDDEQLQTMTKSRHSVATQSPMKSTEQNSIQTTETASLSVRSYRSLSPARVSSGLMNQSSSSIDSKPSVASAPSKTTNARNGRGGLIFQSKYYAAARAARLRDQKEHRQRISLSGSPLSSGNAKVLALPTSQANQLRSNSLRSRSLSRSFSSTHESGLQKAERAVIHRQGHFRSTSERSRSLSRSFSAASTKTLDSNQQPHQAAPFSMSQRTSPTMPPRRKADFTRAPSSSRTFMSASSSKATSASHSTVSEKEHRLNSVMSSDTSPSARGRLANMALERGLATRNGRSRSPFIEKRMRSFSQGRKQTSSLQSTIEQGLQQINRQQRTGGEGKELSAQPSETHDTTENTTKPKGVSVRGDPSNIAAFWNGKINKVSSSPTGPTESPREQRKEQEDKEPNPNEPKPSSLDLMAKLQAVDRANPAQALAQIDFILREEGRKNSFEPILINPNIGNDDDSAGTTISSLTNPDYRDWQHQKLMRSNQHIPNQIASAAVSSFRRPRPSSLQNYSASSLPSKEISSSQISKYQNHPQSISSTPTEKLKVRHSSRLVNASRQEGPNNESITGIKDENGQDSTTSLLPRPSPLPTRRSHPWDGDAPDTASIPVSVEPKEVEIKEERAVAGHAKSNFEIPSNMPRQNREVTREKHVYPNISSDQIVNGISKEGNLVMSQSRSKTPTPRITPRQQENAKKISDNFDTAWALMPESGFVLAETTKKRRGGGSQSSRSSRTLDLNASFDTSNASKSYHSRSVSAPEDGGSEGLNGERFSIEVSLVPRAESSPGKGAGKPKSRKRGFLRALVRRQNGKKGTNSSTNSMLQNSTGMYSGSQSSSGAHSYSTPTSLPSGRSPSLASPPPIRNESRQKSPMNEPSSSGSTSPAKQQDSIDKFRTASMAQKYSRVMRLYDED